MQSFKSNRDVDAKEEDSLVQSALTPSFSKGNINLFVRSNASGTDIRTTKAKVISDEKQKNGCVFNVASLT
jgi:hypothetical protein